ncbi:MAG: DUF4912 domain-containing protein [Cyanobacteriota bacterium]|nr:DUF4912 domain-containing protein [Cyanobacteriota bacterium]
MGSSGFSKAILAQMRLSQLRELARRLGIWRYSSMLREQLITAVQSRSPQAEPQEISLPTPALSELSVESTPPMVSLALDEDTTSSPAGMGFSSWISLTPQDHQWAIARWGISLEDRERAQAHGGGDLALRLKDVTGSVDGSSQPQTLQQVVVAPGSQEWHLPVPLGDRDYRVELGYRTSDGGWLSLALSSVVRIAHESDVPFAPVSPFSFPVLEEAPQWEPPLPAPGLHERLYQRASASRTRLGLGSEGFHDQQARGPHTGAGGQDSGAGPWLSGGGREASGAGMEARQRSFWLVADAELIVYGATDPAATLTVGNQVLPLTEDGTFTLHTAFPDGDQNYPIRALAADGEQTRSITLDFCRRTPHAKVNAREAAIPEWF